MVRRFAFSAVVLSLALAGPAGAAERTGKPVGETELARLLIATTVRAQPTPASPQRGRVAAVRPVTGQTTVLPVIRREARGGEPWLLVRLPGRPAGRTGWIRERNVHLLSSRWRIVVDRARRRALVYRDGRVVERVSVVVGAASTPTPRGRYFVVERVRQRADSRLGPWALATSAYSRVLQEYDGGPGQIALHGRAGDLARDPLGSARSHGCIRFDNEVIRRLARLPTGTPVDIV